MNDIPTLIQMALTMTLAAAPIVVLLRLVTRGVETPRAARQWPVGRQEEEPVRWRVSLAGFPC